MQRQLVRGFAGLVMAVGGLGSVFAGPILIDQVNPDTFGGGGFSGNDSSLVWQPTHMEEVASEIPEEEDATQPPAVPEPSSLALLGTGLVGLAGYARRRKRKNASTSVRVFP